jgi:hypothetical protein
MNDVRRWAYGSGNVVDARDYDTLKQSAEIAEFAHRTAAAKLSSLVDDLRAQRDRLVTAGRNLVNLLEYVGQGTEWSDAEQTDRVFAWYEFDELRAAMGVVDVQTLPPPVQDRSVAMQRSQMIDDTCPNCGSTSIVDRTTLPAATTLPEGAQFCTQCKFTWRKRSFAPNGADKP